MTSKSASNSGNFCDILEIESQQEMELLTSHKHKNEENDCHTNEEEESNSQNMSKMKPLNPKTIENENEKEMTDGGWGWLILIGGFVTMILITLLQVVYGILFSPVWKQFHATSTTIAWIFNTYVFVWQVTALMSGPLCDEFGYRGIALIGGVINAISIILSGFTLSPTFLFFSFSVLGGIGGSLGMSASIFIVPKYFLKRRGFALGIMSLGACIGAFIGPLLSNFLLMNYGYSGACLIFGGILLNQCVAAALYQPAKGHLLSNLDNQPDRKTDTFYESVNIIEPEIDTLEFQTKKLREKFPRKLSQASHYSSGIIEQSAVAFLTVKENKGKITNHQSKCSTTLHVIGRILKSTLESLKSLQSVRVIFIAVSAGCMMMGYANFQMWIPFVVLDAGHSLAMSAWCMSSAAISNAIGKILVSTIVDFPWFNVRVAYMAGLFFISVSIAAFSLRSEFIYLVTCATFWGFSLGVTMGLYSTSIIITVGEELFPAVFGVAAIFTALFFVGIGPLIGMIQDATSNYKYVLWTISFLSFLAVPLWFLMPVAADLDKKREKRKSQPE